MSLARLRTRPARRGARAAALAVFAAAAPGAARGDAPPRRPFPQHVAYAPGTLRPAGPGRSQADLDASVLTAYDRWKSRYLAAAPPDAAGRPVYRVKLSADAGAATVSEGQGYGMLITALVAGADPAAREILDGLWRFYNRHPSTIEPRFMDWFVPANESLNNDENSATDGDLDLAYGLLLADAQWGSDGDVPYGPEARALIEALGRAGMGAQSHLPLLGDWVSLVGRRSKVSEWTPRSSDFMLGHFRCFGRISGDPARWQAVIAACQSDVSGIQATASRRTGLLPEFIVRRSRTDYRPAPPRGAVLEGPRDPFYSYNACRVPWRIGTDALLNGDPASLQQVRKISLWIEAAAGGDPGRIAAGYRLNGRPIPGYRYYSNAFVAPFAVAAMTTSQQEWLNRLYDAVRANQDDYYEDSIALLCLLVMSRNFWDPTR
jgi:endo-1,4-beta-D-glucanase Y